METLADRGYGYHRPPGGFSTPSESVSVILVTVPVTVTATVSETSTSTTPTTSTHSTSVPTPTLASTTSPNSDVTNPSSITTTYVTSQGTSLLTITAVVSNPAGHIQDQANAPGGALFNNRTETIGVFTAVGIVTFAMIVALVAWAARRRTLKRRREEAEDHKSRDFFEDEVNDAGAPSEKSSWGNTSIPESGGVPLQIMTSGGYNMAPPVPPLPSEFSAVPASVASKSPVLSDGGLILSHPYAGAGPFSDSYSNNVRHDRNGSVGTGWTSPARDDFRSPPPSAPLAALPYKNPASNNSTYLPLIHDGAPVSSSSHPSAANHPFASPPTNRKSELYPEDVLWGLGNDGGVGRSLTGKRPVEPPVPLIPADPFASGQMRPPNPAQLPHDPRFSGLFGNVVADSRAEDIGRLSEDFDQGPVVDEQEDRYTIHSHGKSGNRARRVCRPARH
jgi:hypothetical protein